MLVRYCGVGRATAEEVRIVCAFMDNERLSGTSTLDLPWSSLPMCFAGSLVFYQRAAGAILSTSPALSELQLLRDRGLPGHLVVERDDRGQLQAKGRLH